MFFKVTLKKKSLKEFHVPECLLNIQYNFPNSLYIVYKYKPFYFIIFKNCIHHICRNVISILCFFCIWVTLRIMINFSFACQNFVGYLHFLPKAKALCIFLVVIICLNKWRGGKKCVCNILKITSTSWIITMLSHLKNCKFMWN